MPGLKIAILTCSDTRSAARRRHRRARRSSELAEAAGHSIVAYEVCPTTAPLIADMLVRMADDDGADVILTCGGTGLGPRDVTPEATRDVSERLVPGIAEYLRAESLRITPRAMLSRATAVQRGTHAHHQLPRLREGRARVASASSPPSSTTPSRWRPAAGTARRMPTSRTYAHTAPTIYLDHGATSWPKPPEVVAAVVEALTDPRRQPRPRRLPHGDGDLAADPRGATRRRRVSRRSRRS